MERLSELNSQFKSQSTFNTGSVGPKKDDDVVIVSYARTALTKARKGAQRNTGIEAMLAPVLVDVLKKANNVDPKTIQELCVGNVNNGGAGAMNSRMGQFLAGIPETTPMFGINRFCSSGLQAVSTIANAIRANEIDIGIGGGVESMSLSDMNGAVDPAALSDAVFENEKASHCLMSMGQTSENVAEQYGITKAEQDQMAVESNAKAVHAQKMGWSAAEITPYKTIVKDKEDNETEVLVNRDEGAREGTTLESLGKLKPAFKKGGSSTAGNSSQLTDGAAVVLLARRSYAEKHGLPIKGRMLTFAAVGVPPHIMGIGPAVAIPAALKKTGLTVNDIDIFEINEAFASQATMTVKTLGVPKEKLNPRGGAIALGHPLGCTGARMINTLFAELHRTNKKFGVVSMCIGSGQGACGIFERE